MVPDYEAQASGQRRYIGRVLDPSQGVPFKDDETGQMKRHAVFVAKEGVEAFHEVDASTPHLAEYLRHLRDGDLLPGDKFTADLANIPHDPTLDGAAFKAPPAVADKPAPTVAELHAAAVGAPAPKPSTVKTLAPPAAVAAPSDVKVTP